MVEPNVSLEKGDAMPVYGAGASAAGERTELPAFDGPRTSYMGSAMRLGLYIPILDERPAGLGVYIEEVCSRLARLHPDFLIFTGSAEARRPWFHPSQLRPFGARILPSLAGFDGLRRRARRLWWLARGAALDLMESGVDVLFCPVQEGPLRGRVPSVMVMHDLTPLKFPESYGTLSVAQTRWLLPPMLRRAAAVVAVSENTKRDLVGLFRLPANGIEVVGEGFDRAVFCPRSAEEVASVKRRYGVSGQYLLYAGTFSRHKNLELVARALTKIPTPVDHALSLVLVGRKDAGALAEFQGLVRELGLSDRVILPGYVSRDELAALMSGAAAFVYPSRYEGFGLAPLEAMACGAPVIASNVASLPEVVGAGGVLVGDSNERSWADAIRQTLGRPREQLEEGALRQAARFDWDITAARLSSTLARVALEAGL